jgi:ferredoxin/coenzyme F420-reducing hydrogenase delta subunit
MRFLKQPLRFLFDAAERSLSGIFPAPWNPLLNLGALGFFFYWVITASGIYVYIFFDTGVTRAFASVEYMTREQWYAAGVMRSLHRYASDGLVVAMLLHHAREFALDRLREPRWFSWITGIPILVLVFVAGIGGYWLVWDKLAQYVAIVSTEWLDRLPFFGQPIARNFLSPDTLESRFFTLMIFMHIAVPLITLVILWLHLQRVAKPRINPPLGLTIGTGLSLLALSIVHPAVSQGPADLAVVPGVIGLDRFYLPAYPLIENMPGPATWSAALAFLIVMVVIPWLPPMKRPQAAAVNLDNCNGCARCAEGCPYSAIAMQVRSDGKPFHGEAVVDSALCVSCGICAGSCPTAIPFRRMSEFVPGIDLPDRSMAAIRADAEREGARIAGPARIMVFGCVNGVAAERFESPGVGFVPLNCTGQLAPSFIDYVLSRKLADGVVVAGCTENARYNRFGNRWTDLRLAGLRDPQLRKRVPRERFKTVWAGRLGGNRLEEELRRFAAALQRFGPARVGAAAARSARETQDA